ncbi:MAG: isoaspartyl peptidase/L-asparaginase [Nitrospinales bacterium]
MPEKKMLIATHGGAGSRGEDADGAESAAEEGLRAMRAGLPVLEAVCRAVTVLEDDSRFNAGVGSQRRSDGSVQMDAACMDSRNRFGAVAAVEGFGNPIRIAQALTETSCHILAGEGAARFARERNFPVLDPRALRHRPSRATSQDTVGCVAFDGTTFAAALSTGGTKNSLPGRVGDVPLIGCGLYAGPSGAVAATGNGESIFMKLTALQAYRLLEQGANPDHVLKTALQWFDDKTDIGLILVNRSGLVGGANRDMAWFAVEHKITS